MRFNSKREIKMSNFAIYFMGTVLVAVGLALTANKLGAPAIWIVIGVLIVTGFGIMAAVSKTRQKEKSGIQK
jgi:hypothetical protein